MSNYDKDSIASSSLSSVSRAHKKYSSYSERPSSIQVVVRLRPISVEDRKRPGVQSSELAVSASSLSNTVSIPSLSNQLTFDHVFGENATQDSIYTTCVSSKISSFIDGFNITILAYGQTSSGKTYTMGTSGVSNSASDGIIPRAVQAIFDNVNDLKECGNDVSVTVSFMELYNEELIDLLSENVSPSSRSSIIIREDRGKIVWHGIKELQVESANDVSRLLSLGSNRRKTAATEMNEVSSRSHAIFSINLVQTRIRENNTKVTIRSKCHFVDLAGSERLKRTGASGSRAKEGININSGLLALGNVISALGDASKKNTHVPYRDSKLTRLLQDSLGGNSYTTMIACVSPVKADINETYNTLKYANRARNIKNRLKQDQEDVTDVFTLKAIIKDLTEELQRIKTNPSPQSSFGTHASSQSSPTPIHYLIQRTRLLERDLLNSKKKYSLLYSKYVNQQAELDLRPLSPPESLARDDESASTSPDFHRISESVIEEYEQTIKSLEQDISDLNENNDKLESKLKLEAIKTMTLEEDVRSHEEVITGFKTQIGELVSDKSQLEEALHNSHLAGYSPPTRVQELEFEHQQLLTEKHQLNIMLYDLKQEEVRKKEQSHSEASYKELEKQLMMSELARNQLATEVESYKKKLKLSGLSPIHGQSSEVDSKANPGETINYYQREEASLTETDDHRKNQLSRIRDLEIEIEQKSQKLILLESQFTKNGISLPLELTEHSTSLGGYDAENNKQCQTDNLTADVLSLEKSKKLMEAEIRDLRFKLKKTNLSNNTFKLAADLLEAKIKKQTVEIKSLDESLKAMECLHNETCGKFEESCETISNLKTKLETIEEEIKVVYKELERKDATIVKLRERLMDREAKIISLENTLGLLELSPIQPCFKVNASKSNPNISQVSDHHDGVSYSQKVDMLTKELNSSQESASNLRHRMGELTAHKNESLQQISKLKAQIESTESWYKVKTQQLEQERATLGEQLVALQKKHEILVEKGAQRSLQANLEKYGDEGVSPRHSEPRSRKSWYLMSNEPSFRMERSKSVSPASTYLRLLSNSPVLEHHPGFNIFS